MTDINRKKYLTVTELNSYVKLLMDHDGVLSSVCVRGEVSNFKRHYSGHLYFSLKDDTAAIRCVMFSSSAASLAFEPADGSDVIAFGRVSSFPRDGVYQLYVTSMLNAGLGDTYAAFERLKAKLSAEGLFEDSRKKKIPRFPNRIGIITSATGAAVRDLITVTGRRYPLAELLLYPAQVQGSGAAASVAAGIRYFNRHKNVDVIIAGRGGGSYEDLSCFNDEALARTAAASEIPLISAVGHETDFTILDFVADLRAPTPSAAAELAVPDASELQAGLRAAKERMNAAVAAKVTRYGELLDRLVASGVLSSPEKVLDSYSDQVLSLAMRQDRAAEACVSRAEASLASLAPRPKQALTAALSRAETSLASLAPRPQQAMTAALSRAEAQVASLAAGLEAMSPLRVLSRGYSLAQIDGSVITDAASLQQGDILTVRFRDGSCETEIKEIHPHV